MLLPTASHAIKLHWTTGADTMTFTSALRCTLLVQADDSEGRLPPEWRLLWVADAASVEFVPMDSVAACLLDLAQVSRIDGPTTPADSAANLTTAYLCSEEGSPATTAWQALDIPTGGHGKFKVVAIDPSDPDSGRVLESNEVTYNGGMEGEFAPALLAASSAHQSTELRVTAIGTGLATASSLTIGAPDGFWRVPLTITLRSNTNLVAVADVPAALPSAVVVTESPHGELAFTSIAPDHIDEISAIEASLPDTVFFRDPDAATGWYPKDFSFFYNVVPTGNIMHPWKGLFHLMYIRARHSTSGSDTALAHAWSEDLTHWRVDKHAFGPRHNLGWEDKAVWAPSLLAVGDSCVMFYTGVDPTNNQRIGYAKTAVLDTTDTNATWVRQVKHVYSADSTGWADKFGTRYGAVQFRDPFVMPDPDTTGRFLLFNIGQDSLGMSTVVGAARNVPGTLNRWRDLGKYRSTDSVHVASMVRSVPPNPSVVESPLAMRDSTGSGPWRIFLANAGYNSADSSTFFITQEPGLSVVNTAPGNWPGIDNLYTYLGNNGSLVGWQACEHLQVGEIHFFAGFNGDGIAITRTYWDPVTKNFVIGNPIVGVLQDASTDVVHFYLEGYRPGDDITRFALEAEGRVTPRLILYDSAGRRVLTLCGGRQVQGPQRWRWDCRDEAGRRVPSGMYFARLTGMGAPKVLRFAVIR
jgi:hypothetical protein